MSLEQGSASTLIFIRGALLLASLFPFDFFLCRRADAKCGFTARLREVYKNCMRQCVRELI